LIILFSKENLKMLGTSKEIKYPGLNVLPPGVERHIVNGGGLTGIQLFPDDEIEIANSEVIKYVRLFVLIKMEIQILEY